MRSAESKGDVEQVALYRLQLALRYARDGRQEDALNAFAQVAAEHPGYADDAARIYASALCYLLGRPEEGHRWLAGDDHSPSDIYNTFMFMDAVKIATFGSTPHAVEASRKLVVFSAWGWSRSSCCPPSLMETLPRGFRCWRSWFSCGAPWRSVYVKTMPGSSICQDAISSSRIPLREIAAASSPAHE
ncbi:hypothetical protein GUJ93_ZPchr0140g33418 [Zizania palustris]|uniref:Tetratricopeptide repeat protein n=1 Tax=Zizania palustris TaxID=103762 RepID=A0A8J5QWA3_ZIZPA|nr:hypothetical protein GUJ93_ZPchr0140g33418 [Zizania palustris]